MYAFTVFKCDFTNKEQSIIVVHSFSFIGSVGSGIFSKKFSNSETSALLKKIFCLWVTLVTSVTSVTASGCVLSSLKGFSNSEISLSLKKSFWFIAATFVISGIFSFLTISGCFIVSGCSTASFIKCFSVFSPVLFY